MSQDTAGIRNIGEKASLAEQVKTAIGVHGLWKHRIVQAIETGKSEWEPAKVAPHNLCDFGKWLETVPVSERSEHYNKVHPLHASFHKEAARVLELAVTGKTEAARTASERNSAYGKLTSDLTGAMMTWLKAVE